MNERYGCEAWDTAVLREQVGRWLADYTGPPELVLSLECDVDHVSDGGFCLTAEGPAVIGQLTVRDPGEVVIEVFGAHRAEPRMQTSGKLHTAADLLDSLALFVGACSGRGEVDDVAELPARSRALRTRRSAGSPRRLQI